MVYVEVDIHSANIVNSGTSRQAPIRLYEASFEYCSSVMLRMKLDFSDELKIVLAIG
jgi:hypothetical protein